MLKLAPPLVVLAVAGALLLGAQASGQSATVTVEASAADQVFRIQPGDKDPNTIVLAGTTVAFTHASGLSHNVRFTAGGQPACTQSSGPNLGAVPPLPAQPSGDAWSGTCTFATAARYEFACDLHPSMKGSITVLGGGSPPPPAPAPPPPSPLPPGTSPPPPPGPTPPPPPAAPGAAASRPTVALRQRGNAVRGSIVVRSAKSRLLARAFARRGALSGGTSTLAVQVGRQDQRSVGGRRVAFSVSLNAVARRAMRRNGRLAITLRLTVTPPAGRSYTAARTVILRPA